MTPLLTGPEAGPIITTKPEGSNTSDSEPDDPTQHTFTLTPGLLSTIHPTYSSLKNSLRTQTRSLRNRLVSITTDSQFVLRVAAAYALPLIPNARAGDWYVPPEQRGSNTSAYFKSTDGHTGQWGFSLRRLNLHVLECVGKYGGVVLVDSTRRGKRFPDALSRTVPVWIAVMNWCLFGAEFGKLFSLEQMVSGSEKVQIERLVPGFVGRFLELGVDLSMYKQTITKPLRPIWVSPESTLPISPPKFEEFTPVILLTASKMTRREGMEGEYIQGAGDDHEGWATESGLTPPLFWHHHKKIMSTAEQDLLDLIKNLLPPPSLGETTNITSSNITRIGQTNVFIAPTSSIPTLPSTPPFDHIICTSPTFPPFTEGTGNPTPSHYPIPNTAPGAKLFRKFLPEITSSVTNPGGNVLVTCDTGEHVSPCVALVFLCMYYDDEGGFRRKLGEGEEEGVVGKTYIRRRLAWITTAKEGVNPARGFLNGVNASLMGRR
ncbi:initiator tRNA phosphoribosyl transferase [Choiromyces venosus 120613-1]|uniref:Initiator tRNA phosphoribosyl transferase n=1 Tax=Choiromyces venosus 120613-1 TaxID=1336337 RepID=A0A3N4KIM8_9PEZI|nr:initiator tRNA phosphoribosyl transferase [Choiromyces venosus 120613-1]